MTTHQAAIDGGTPPTLELVEGFRTSPPEEFFMVVSKEVASF